jgi:septal ring factor EnvC (AmiA/AmiB activator)
MKPTKLLTVACLGLVMVLFTQCDTKKQNNNDQQIDELESDWKEEKNELKKDWQDLIDKIDSKIENAQEKLDEAGDESKERWNKRIEDLNKKKASVKKNLYELDEQNKDNWSKFKADSKNAFDNFNDELEKIGDDIEDVLDN